MHFKSRKKERNMFHSLHIYPWIAWKVRIRNEECFEGVTTSLPSISSDMCNILHPFYSFLLSHIYISLIWCEDDDGIETLPFSSRSSFPFSSSFIPLVLFILITAQVWASSTFYLLSFDDHISLILYTYSLSMRKGGRWASPSSMVTTTITTSYSETMSCSFSQENMYMM